MPQDLNVNLAELRSIIQALKLSGLSFVESEAVDIIKQKISRLPSAELLTNLYDKPESLKEIRKEIGSIMYLIDAYGTKGFEFKSRHKINKNNLPPRYRTLDWRKPE